MYEFRGNMAEKYGLNAAVVAEYLYTAKGDLERMEFLEYNWMRCSARQITIDNPFLTVDMVKYAIRTLREDGVIRSKKIRKSGFDHTNWYTFTEYGRNLMEGGNPDDTKN